MNSLKNSGYIDFMMATSPVIQVQIISGLSGDFTVIHLPDSVKTLEIPNTPGVSSDSGIIQINNDTLGENLSLHPLTAITRVIYTIYQNFGECNYDFPDLDIINQDTYQFLCDLFHSFEESYSDHPLVKLSNLPDLWSVTEDGEICPTFLLDQH